MNSHENTLPKEEAAKRDYGITLTKEEETKVDELCQKIRAQMTSERMTPRQRLDAVMRGEQHDRIPIAVDGMGLHVAMTYGVSPLALTNDPKLCLIAYLDHLVRFGYDWMSPFYFTAGEEELGGELLYSETSLPILKRGAIESLDDLKKFKFPNVYKDGKLPWILWVISVVKEKLGDIMPIFSVIGMPGALSGIQTPVEKMSLFYKQNKPLAHCAGALVMRFDIEYANAIFEAGADGIMMPSIDSICSFKNHLDFELPYVAGLIKSVGKPFYTFGSGDWSHVLDSFGKAGISGYFHYNSGLDLQKGRAAAMKHNIILHYGIDNHLMVHGPKEKIRERVKQVIKEGYPGCKFALRTDTLDFNTPVEHVETFMEAAREYGQLPLKI